MAEARNNLPCSAPQGVTMTAKLQTIWFCETVTKDRQAYKNRHHSSRNPSAAWVCLWLGENQQVTKASALAESS